MNIGGNMNTEEDKKEIKEKRIEVMFSLFENLIKNNTNIAILNGRKLDEMINILKRMERK